MKQAIKILTVLMCCITQQTFAQVAETALVKGGTFVPQYGVSEEKSIRITDFVMDTAPVTHAQYLQFVQEYPQWKKSKVRRLFADGSYLKNWSGDSLPPKELLHAPVTHISWYAAKACCECMGKRLPTTNEWEYAAMASDKKRDARKDSLYNAKIMAAYETRQTYLKNTGKGTPNYWGIYDLNELVWEWTSDFNAVMLSGENRDNNDKNLFCGAGSLNATDLMNYTAFLRYAFRNSIKANYNIASLGFRCVK